LEGVRGEGGVVEGEEDGEEERSGVSATVVVVVAAAAGETGRATTAARAGTLRVTVRMKRAGMRGREEAEAEARAGTGTATTVESQDIWRGIALPRPPLRRR
jgi:hypothetical protein